MPGLEGALAAVSYEAVHAGLATVDDFGGSAGQDDVPDIDKNIAAMVEPRHGKVRRIMNSVVAFHRSQQIEPYLQDLVRPTLDDMMAEAAVKGDEGVDVVRHLAGAGPARSDVPPVRFPGVRRPGVREVGLGWGASGTSRRWPRARASRWPT